MSITMNNHAGRKGKRGPTSPTQSIHSPPTCTSPLPKIKLSLRATPKMSRASSSSRPRSVASNQRGGIFSDSSSSDLTPPEDDDDEEDFPPIVPRSKGKKRESIGTAAVAKDKGKAKAISPQNTRTINTAHDDLSTPKRPSAVGPGGRDRKRVIKLGEVARRRARDDKFGFGGDRFSGITPAQRITNPLLDSDSTSSYGDDESERETLSQDGDETEDEVMGGLPEAFAGQEIEDLAYGAGLPDSGMEEEAEQEWWQEQDEDEDFIAALSGSDIEGLQSQSSVHSESDDPMTDSTASSDADDTTDEFGFPLPFTQTTEQTSSDAPLILMENWDGQFVLVQPRHERPRSRHRGDRGSRTAGSVGESTSMSAGEQQLVIDADADDDTDSSDWSGLDGDDDGGDTTDSMAEEDMPVLDSPALDEIIGQQLTGYTFPTPMPSLLEDPINPTIVVTDTAAETPALSTTSSTSNGPTAGLDSAATTPAANILPGTPIPLPVMGSFAVNEEPCAHAVIDGSKTTTKSPFTRRRRSKPCDTASVASSSKRRSRMGSTSTLDPFSPVTKKSRYSSIPGHPRFLAARRAAQNIVDERETTPSEEDETAFSLEDMLDASVLRMNDLEASASNPSGEQDELRHLFRFDKVPVSMYMRRNFNSSASKSRAADPSLTPSHNSVYHAYSSPIGRGTNGIGLTGTLAGPLAHPASRMLISPLLAPLSGAEYEDPETLSRKERRKARKQRGTEMAPLQI